MPFVAAPNIIQVEIRYLLYGQHIENRIMVDNAGPVLEADLVTVAVAAWDWAENDLMPLSSDELHLSQVVTTDLSTAEGGQYTYAPDTTTEGGVSGSMLPNEVAFCVSLHTGTRGRSARGRMFLPAIPVVSTVDANNLTGAAAGAYVAAVTTLINDLTEGERFPVIVSYIHDGAPREGGPVYFPITGAASTDTILDSQRRRKPGNGS